MRPKTRSQIDAELRAFLDSTPPPPALLAVVERVHDRISTETGRHDIEELQRHLRESTEKAAAEKIAEANRRAEAAERKLEKKAEQAFEIAKLIIAAAIGGLVDRMIKK